MPNSLASCGCIPSDVYHTLTFSILSSIELLGQDVRFRALGFVLPNSPRTTLYKSRVCLPESSDDSVCTLHLAPNQSIVTATRSEPSIHLVGPLPLLTHEGFVHSFQHYVLLTTTHS